jgi:SAM-dependent methyltransferase
MWWFGGLHANVETAFQRSGALRSNPVILDAGCGTGGLLRKLACDLSHRALGVDIDESACAMARAKSKQPVCVGSVNCLPFADRSFSAIISADVLYHHKVEEPLALREFHRCLVPDGVLVLNLPAYRWLFSAHDRAVHSVRRYTRARVHRMLGDAGFGSIRSTYWNTLLFPLLVVRRMITSRNGESDVIEFPMLFERAFRGIMRFENTLLRRGIILPFGSSVLATAIKT